MKRLLLNNIIFVGIIIFTFACGTNNRRINHTEPSGGASQSASGTHDTINKKVEIRHQGADQKRIDSIKDEKIRKKK